MLASLFGRSSAHSALKTSKKGIVTMILMPEQRLRVKYQSTEWFAQSVQGLTFQPGDLVQVVGRLNATTLLIETAID